MSEKNTAEQTTAQPNQRKLSRHRSVQVNFRVSSKWLQIVRMLAKLEGRSPSALMRELLTLGLAQYVNMYYRTPQLVRRQQLEAVLHPQFHNATAQGKFARKNDV